MNTRNKRRQDSPPEPEEKRAQPRDPDVDELDDWDEELNTEVCITTGGRQHKPYYEFITVSRSPTQTVRPTGTQPHRFIVSGDTYKISSYITDDRWRFDHISYVRDIGWLIEAQRPSTVEAMADLIQTYVHAAKQKKTVYDAKRASAKE